MTKEQKKQRLYLVLGCFFVANAIIAEFIGIKIFSVEGTLGIQAISLKLFGYDLSFNMTAGVLIWPVVFVMTDIINEYFGRKGVRIFSYLAAALICYAFLGVYLAIHTEPAGFWKMKKLETGSINMDDAFNHIFGQGLWIIVASLVAFLLAQVVDVFIFRRIKKITGEKYIWLRANGSTVVSQLIDSFVVLYIAFYLSKYGTPDQWELSFVLAVCLVNYVYKVIMALILTPILYLVHKWIDAFLGEELSEELRREALD